MTSELRPEPNAGGDERVRALVDRLVQAETDRARVQRDLEELLRRRAVRFVLTVSEMAHYPRSLRHLPGALRGALTKSDPLALALRPSVDRLLRDVDRAHEVLGQEAGLRYPLPHLRLGHLGEGARFASVAPTVRLSPGALRRDLGAGLDLLTIDLERRLPTGSGGMVEAVLASGVPVVACIGAQKQLDHRLTESATLLLVADAELAQQARRAVGTERVVELSPAVDPHRDNPIGWTPACREVVAIPVNHQPSNWRGVAEATEAVRRAGLQPELHLEGKVDVGSAPSGLDAYSIVRVPTGQRFAEEMTSVRAAVLAPDVFPRSARRQARRRQLEARGVPVLDSAAQPGSGDTAAILEEWCDDLARERHSVRRRRHTLMRHTQFNRLCELLERLGMPTVPTPLVSVLMSTNRPDRMRQGIASVAAQSHPRVELQLVLHGPGFSPAEARNNLVAKGLDGRVHTAPERWTLGDCLNLALDHASGRYVAKMDDDDFYGEKHLTDLLAVVRYADADVVGKQGHFAYLSESDVTVDVGADSQESVTAHLPGGTWMARRELIDRFRFNRVRSGEDTRMWAAMKWAGARLYSTHRLNYTRHRHGEHTYGISDRRFLDRAGREALPGLRLGRTEA